MKKTFKYFLLILILILLFLIIKSTYSKYITTQDSSTDLHVTNWNITITTNDINMSGRTFEGIIGIIKDENPYIDENVVAPTSSGTFEVIITSTGTELDFDYDFSFVEENVNNLADFRITKYEINDEEAITVGSDQTNITGEVLHKDVNEEVVTKFKFYVEWYDGDDNILNNAQDVAVSKDEDNPNAVIPLKLTVVQKAED